MLLQSSRTAGHCLPVFDPDTPPPEPPEILDVFENQRYISKLIQWSLEASKRERSRPHLVENDDDPER